MGNQCCGQPAEGQPGNYEVNNKKENGDGQSIAKYENSTAHHSTFRHKIEEINEKEVVRKTDFQVGEGATYTGQMKEVPDSETGQKVYIKHGKGTQIWLDGAKYEGDWRNGMAEGQGNFHHANGDVYTGEFY